MPKSTKDEENIKISKKTNTTKKSSSDKNVSISKKIKSKKAVEEKSITPKEKISTAKATKITKNSIVKKIKTATPEEFKTLEYYDLPSYNQTTVKLLAQTPKTLFVYWNISEDDRKKYIEQYGENFFETTKPFLVINNKTMNYSFEVEINDFANCWYLNISDSKCEYLIELIRKPISTNSTFNTNTIFISSSNQLEAPNDHILFDKNQQTVYFKNVKTNNISSKSINFSYMRNLGKIYNIYDIYTKIYKDELIEDFDLSNPSSGNPSSTFK